MTLDYLAPLVAVAANAHAIAVVVGVRRTAPASTLRRLANRCGKSVVVLVAFSICVLLWEVRQGFSAVDPSEKASQIAGAISAAINCSALVVVASVLPSAVALWLSWRTRRAP